MFIVSLHSQSGILAKFHIAPHKTTFERACYGPRKTPQAIRSEKLTLFINPCHSLRSSRRISRPRKKD